MSVIDGIETFWMCYVEGRQSPRQVHETLMEAQVEAARIALKEQCRVIVLQSVTYCELAVTWHETVSREENNERL